MKSTDSYVVSVVFFIWTVGFTGYYFCWGLSLEKDRLITFMSCSWILSCLNTRRKSSIVSSTGWPSCLCGFKLYHIFLANLWSGTSPNETKGLTASSSFIVPSPDLSQDSNKSLANCRFFSNCNSCEFEIFVFLCAASHLFCTSERRNRSFWACPFLNTSVYWWLNASGVGGFFALTSSAIC